MYSIIIVHKIKLYINNVRAIFVYIMSVETRADKDILEQALLAVRNETGLCLYIEEIEAQFDNDRIDAIVGIDGGNNTFAAVIKKWAQQANLGALVNQIQNLPEKGLLVADYVNPNMAKKLRQKEVQFIDTAGNAYINAQPIYVYVAGNRKEIMQFMPTQTGAKRAFEPTGLKVIFAFLCQPQLVNAPYREIAEKASVAVGTVGWVLNGLKAADFIRDKGGKKGRRLINYKKLLERWVEAYPEKLKPKQIIGEFIADDQYWWKDIDIQNYNGYWGGEIAAAKYTGYLKPQVAIVYLHNIALTRLLVDARLRKITDRNKDKPGTVIIYEPFWTEAIMEQDVEPALDINEGLVHPILAYADLVATGDTRNLETARRIYDEYITRYFRED